MTTSTHRRLFTRARRRGSAFLRLGVPAIVAAPMVIGVLVAEPFASATTALPFDTNFEIDGNPQVNSTGDWLSSSAQYPALRDNFVTTTEPCGGGTDPDRFKPGTKLDDINVNNASPSIQEGNVLTKGDICAVRRAWELVLVPDDPADPAAGGQYHFISYLSWSRVTTNGEIDVLIPLLGIDPNSQSDDVVVNYDFDDNTQVTTLNFLKWNGTTWVENALPAGTFEATTVEGVTDPAVPAPQGTNLTFGEYAIDLTAAGLLPENGPCATFSNGALASRTGNSPTATLEDAVGLPPLTLTNCSSLNVVKQTTPTPTSAQSFGFTVNQVDGAQIQPNTTQINPAITVPPNPNTTTINNLLISPDYVVEETSLPPSWSEVSLVCTSFDPITGQPVTRTLYDGSPGPDASFPLAPNSAATCTMTNIGPPTVTVTKTVQGTTASWSFDFTISPVPTGETATKTATNANPTVGWQLEAGVAYTITETPKPGYVTGTVDCGDGATFTPAAGEQVECSVTNVELASVDVTKTVLGTTTPWSFDFTISPVPAGETATKTATNLAATVGWDGLVPGTAYTITEATEAGYVNGAVDCGDGATFTPTAGEAVACAVTNTELASVDVTKTVLGTTTGWSFDFTISPVPAGETATKTATNLDATVGWDGLVPGTAYTITEATEAGYVNGAVDCGDGATFTPTPGEAVACAVTNTELGRVDVTKTVDGTSDDWEFDFTISPVPVGEPATKTATAGDATVSWEGLVPGTAYTITEGAVDGFINGAVDCGDGATFSPAPGQTVECSVTNTELGSVDVTKRVVGTATAWSFDFTISPVPAGETATKAATNAAPTVHWDGLDPSVDYTITEAAEPGFVNGTVACGEGGATFSPPAGGTVSCLVSNAQLASVDVTKTVAGNAATWSFDFTIAPVPAGETATKSATNVAPTVGWDGLVSGTAYTITETGQTGFTTGTLTCTTGTNGVGTSTFTPTAGQAVTCAITNDVVQQQAPPVADIAVVKTATPTVVTPGGNVTWTLVATNNGPDAADNAAIVDNLPSTLTLVSFTTPAGWDCSGSVTGNPGRLSCTKPTMGLNESATFTLTTTVAAAAAGTTINNTAVVSTSTSETTTSNNQDAEPITVQQAVLPPTGGYVWNRVAIAAGLLFAGMALVAIDRRRRTIP